MITGLPAAAGVVGSSFMFYGEQYAFLSMGVERAKCVRFIKVVIRCGLEWKNTLDRFVTLRSER